MPHCFSSWTSAHGFVISCCGPSIPACDNPCSAISAIFITRHMSDCSSCNRPPCLAIVAVMLKTYKKLVSASRVRNGCYLNHLRLCSLLCSLYSLFCPFPRTFVLNFASENPRTDNIVLFNFADCAAKCLGRRCRIPVTARDDLVTSLSTYPSCALYCWLTVVYIDMDWLTSDCMLHYSCCFQLYILFLNGHPGSFFGGYKCSVTVNWLVSSLLLCLTGWRNVCSAWRSARFVFNCAWLKYFWSHDLLLWNGEEDDNEKKWEVRKII